MRRTLGSRAASVLAVWDRFWFAEASPLGLALFRIAFALCLLREVETSRVRSLGALAGGFHWPYVSFIPRLDEPLYDLLHTAQYPLILLLAIGLATRLSCAALLGLQSWIFFADRLQFRNHPWFFLLVLLLLLPSPAGAALSIRAWWRSTLQGSATLPPRPLTWQRLIQLQVSIVYFFAGLHKLHPAYLRGDVLRGWLEQEPPGTLAGRWAVTGWAHDLPLMPAISALTVTLELALPVALWLRPTRAWAIVAGVAFHGTIAILMGAGAFSLSLIASYILFFEPRDLAHAFASRGAAPSARPVESRRSAR